MCLPAETSLTQRGKLCMQGEGETCIHGALAGACPHNCVDLINEQHNAPIAGSDLLDDSLQPVLKLSPVLGSRYQGSKVKRHQSAVLQGKAECIPSACERKDKKKKGKVTLFSDQKETLLRRQAGAHQLVLMLCSSCRLHSQWLSL